MKTQRALCQVCFTDSHNLLPHNPLVNCQQCMIPVHTYCYSPKKIPFTCDNCLHCYKGTTCKLCNQGGLLKKCGNFFAHPLCLFFDSGAIVADYGQLAFEEISCQRRNAKHKCNECGLSSINVISCASKGCNNKCHIYCAYKGGQSSGWKVLNQPREEINAYFDAYNNAYLRTIRSRNKFLAGQLGLKKSMQTRGIALLAYCRDHSQTIIQCDCREFNQMKEDWVFCQGCCRWLHTDCLHLTKQEKAKLDQREYICKECNAWKEWVENKGNHMPIPNPLPKMQLYDYIFLHVLAQEQKHKTSESVLSLLSRIPITPGLIYGECFFRREIYNQLKAKINLSQIRANIQGHSREQMCSFFMKERDRLELIWLIMDGWLFRSKNNQAFPHLVEEDNEDSFLQNIFELLIKFEEKYSLVPSTIFQKALKNAVQDQEEEHKKGEQESSGGVPVQQNIQPIGHFTRSGRTAKKQTKMVAEKVQKEKSRSKQKIKQFDQQTALEQELQKCLIQFQESSKEGGKKIQSIFDKLFKLIKKPLLQEQIQIMPDNPFKRSLSLNNSKLATSYMEFFGTFNHFQELWKDFLKDREKLPSTAQLQTIESYQWRASSFRQTIYYVEDQDLQEQLLTELFTRESEDRLATGFELFKEYDKLEWYHEYQHIPQTMMTIKHLKGQVELAKINKQYPLNLHAALSVLEQLKLAKFDEATFKAVNTLRQTLHKLRKAPTQIIDILDNFIILFKQTKLFLQKIRNTESDPKSCLMKELNSLNLFIKNALQSQQNILVEYLQSIQNIRLSFFKLEIQKTFKQKITSYVEVLEKRKKIFSNERQLQVVRKWVNRFRIYSQVVKKVIDADTKASSMLTFTRLNFEDYDRTLQLQKSLEQSKSIYKQHNLEFRVLKVDRLLEWIKVYKLILNQTPLEYLLNRQEWAKATYQVKPSLDILKKLQQVLLCLQFPDNTLKSNLKIAVEQTEGVRQQFKKMCQLCNWDNQPEFKDRQKMSYAEVKSIFERAKECPLGLQVQIIECQIIIQKFEELQAKAEAMLKGDVEYDSVAMFEIAKKLEAGPIYSPCADRLKKTLKEQWRSEDKQNERFYHQILSSLDEKRPNYHNVLELRNYFRDSYKGNLTIDQCVSTLDELLEPINQCYSQFAVELEQFNSRNGRFSEGQLQRITNLEEIYRQSKLRDNTVERLCIEVKKHEVALLQKERITCNKEDGIQLTNEETNNYEALLTILHSCLAINSSQKQQ